MLTNHKITFELQTDETGDVSPGDEAAAQSKMEGLIHDVARSLRIHPHCVEMPCVPVRLRFTVEAWGGAGLCACGREGEVIRTIAGDFVVRCDACQSQFGGNACGRCDSEACQCPDRNAETWTRPLPA